MKPIYKVYLTSLFYFIFIVSPIHSHPVIWKDGLVFNTTLSTDRDDYNTHLSVRSNWSVGLHGLRLFDRSYLMLQNNLLLKRWNIQNAQANIYLFSGIGQEIQPKPKSIYHIGLQLDYETRAIYTQLNIDGYWKMEPTYFTRARIGFAPYFAEFNAIQTYCILQFNHYFHHNQSSPLSILPILRHFKGNILIEYGTNLNQYLLTLMLHI